MSEAKHTDNQTLPAEPNAPAVVKYHSPKIWVRYPETKPTIPGVYAVMVSGDSERDGAHVFYDFGDYQTFARLYHPDADGHQRFDGIHDEEEHTFFAWLGPIEIPKFDWRELGEAEGSAIEDAVGDRECVPTSSESA